MDAHSLQPYIEAAFADRSKLSTGDTREAIRETIARLDRGELRVAERSADGEWVTHAWVKQAILLYFAIQGMERDRRWALRVLRQDPAEEGPRTRRACASCRRASVRYGAFLEPGAIVMPGYVNIGARVGAGTMVDTWATVGSCAQIGKDCHLAGGVGIGGVLEPPGARPGHHRGRRASSARAPSSSRACCVEREAVIGAGVVLTASTAIIDVTGPERRSSTAGACRRAAWSSPACGTKKFPAGEFGMPCALIIGKRSESTDRKVSLNAALRDFAVPV